jgi:hypothetical protein
MTEVGTVLRDRATHERVVHTQVRRNLNEAELDALAVYLTSLK